MIKKGMYVRCSFDTDQINPRDYMIGQVYEVDLEGNRVLVVFHDPLMLRSFFTSLPSKDYFAINSIQRCSILNQTYVDYNDKKIRVVSIAKKPCAKYEYYNYYCEYLSSGEIKIAEVCETKIKAPFTRANYNPANQMLNFELQNPAWYLKRRVVSESLNSINNSPYGFKSLLGTRVQLFPHQVDTVIKALSERHCRLMLADEVGLGKTIEACSIVKGKLDQRPKSRILFITPDTLVYQWQTELSFKFWLEVPIWGEGSFENSNLLLISTMEIKNDVNILERLGKWDMCVIDESHKLLYDKAIYQSIYQFSKGVEDLLLLSATPILQREEEYYMLLKLLNPKRFDSVSQKEFSYLIKKQRDIRDIIYSLMKDLKDYIPYDLSRQFIVSLNTINQELNDNKLASLIEGIDTKSVDQGLNSARLALSYISEFYQIEKNIIRHRRTELDTGSIIRRLREVPYQMAGSEVGFYEENCHDKILDYADMLLTSMVENDLGEILFIKKLISAFFSSPFALLEIINERTSNRHSMKTNEQVIILGLLNQIEKWEHSTNNEIKNILKVCNGVENFHGRFAKIVDFIDQEGGKEDKYLIFTSFLQTALKLEECFVNFFGVDMVTSFQGSKSREEMQEAATKFQNNKGCRFIICDESGGEGRNFQIADYVIHFDIPWSPALVEQRIGRLDRIGREEGKDVISVVIFSTDTIENDLFSIYNNGLNVFNESLCGMEIVFEELHDLITSAFNSDVHFGLKKVLDKVIEFSKVMKLEVEKERYFDLAKQLDHDLRNKIGKQIKQFTENDGERLMNTMLSWPSMAGFNQIFTADTYKDGFKIVHVDTTHLNYASMLNTLYFPPKMDEIIRRSRYKNDILGTFSRNAAVRHENLNFFAPFNPFFDSITTNAEECYKGSCCAFKYSGCKISWTGIITTWNVSFNLEKLIKSGYPIGLSSLISQFTFNDQIVHANAINSNIEMATALEITREIEEKSNHNPIHLGKRENNAIEIFKRDHPKELWQAYVKKSYDLGKEYSRNQIKLNLDHQKILNVLENHLYSKKVREIFYGLVDHDSLSVNEQIIDALIYGLEEPSIELDSIAFVRLRKD